MDAFLLLVGLALFLTGAGMYLTHAAQHEPRWVAGSLLMPLVVPLYYRRHWDDLQLAGLLQSAGLVMSLAGGLMLAFAEEAPETFGGVVAAPQNIVYSGFVDSDRALLLLARQGPGTRVAGRIHGRTFEPDRVELVDGVLRLRQGEGFLPGLEVAVFLDTELPVNTRLKRVVSPNQDARPEVQVTWRDGDGLPVSRTFRKGYRLDLELVPMTRGKLGGYIQLTLPDAEESYVAGDLEVLTTHLRYRGGEVDRTYDHVDTLAFIAEEYLAAQYKEGDVSQVSVSDAFMDVIEGRAQAIASVQLHDGRVGKHVIRAAKTNFGWSVLGNETLAATEAAGFKPVYSLLPPPGLREQREPQKRSVAAPVINERTLAFPELSAFNGQGAVVEMTSGRREQGVLRGIDRDRLVVEVTKGGGGVVQFRVSEKELVLLRLNSGEVIRLAGAAPGRVVSTTQGGTAEQAAPATISAAGHDLTPFLNKSVRVTTQDGKVTTGVFRGVQRDRLIVEIMVGGGKVDYTVPAAQLASIELAGR